MCFLFSTGLCPTLMCSAAVYVLSPYAVSSPPRSEAEHYTFIPFSPTLSVVQSRQRKNCFTTKRKRAGYAAEIKTRTEKMKRKKEKKKKKI
eukprot:m.290041 g.290041  ORF g.290041 m.290041 type:complete len:91 (+) comp12229_c0_seq1:1436-1708(+)